MDQSDWRKGLGFASRMTAVTKITSAYQKADPSLSAEEARKEAIISESAIYDDAQSTDDYDRLCEAKIASFPSHPLEFPTSEDEEYVPTPDGIDIGKYQNTTYHREGLFSVIYKAAATGSLEYFPSDTPSKTKVVALKVTTPSLMEPPHDSKREARILKLSVSERVIPLLENFQENGSRLVLVFPFMPFDFESLLRDKKLSKEQIKNCLKDMFTALAFIHKKEIIHRDIKPANILLKSLDGPAYLSDFGIAWAPEVPGSEVSNAKITDVGTTCYRPPELLFGNKRYGCSLDLWAAGCTVAEAVDHTHATLFDSGELGSDLALIQSMFKKLGTPNLTVWPEAANLPDWGKMQFYDYPTQPWSTLLPDASEAEWDLVDSLIRYESGTRLTAAEVLDHTYFAS